MPNKHNADRRHHIPKMEHRVTNWPEYEAGLRSRGSLTLWITPDALAQWAAAPRTTRGGQAQSQYSDVAIESTLMLGCAFKLRLRQTGRPDEFGARADGADATGPDHTTLSRRAKKRPVVRRPCLPAGPLDVLIDSTGLKVFGAGQWLQEKHGAKSRRGWRKLHLAVDSISGLIVAHTLTEQDIDDPSQVAPLLGQIDGEIAKVIADGAYDGAPTYQTIAQHGDGIEIVIPPRSTAVRSCEHRSPTQRDSHLEVIEAQGRLAWQVATGYGKRARVETTMGRYKTLIGTRLHARDFAAQHTEVAIGVAVLNRMLAAGRPHSVRREAHFS